MEHKGSLPCLQEPATALNPEQMPTVHNLRTYCLRYILILSSHLRLGLPCGLFLSDVPTKIVYTFVIVPSHHL